MRLLRSQGYYTPSPLRRSIGARSARPVARHLTASPGYIYNLGDINITVRRRSAWHRPRALALESGRPIIAEQVEAAEANVLLRRPSRAIPSRDRPPTSSSIPPRGSGLHASARSGPRATFGGFTTEGDLAFDARHVGVLARFDRGELYDRRKVDDLREAMVATRLFESVSAEPVLTGETAPDGSQYVNILVRQDAGPPRSFDGNAGYSTGAGLRLEGAWEHRNIFRPEGSLRVAAIAGTAEQNLRASALEQLAPARPARSCPVEAGQRDHEAFRATPHVSRPGDAGIDADLAEVWTYAMASRSSLPMRAGSARTKISLQRRLFHRGLIGQLATTGRTACSIRLALPAARPDSIPRPRSAMAAILFPHLIEVAYSRSGEFRPRRRARFGSITASRATGWRRRGASMPAAALGAWFGYQELGPREEVPNPDFRSREARQGAGDFVGPLGGGRWRIRDRGRYPLRQLRRGRFVDDGQVYEASSDLRLDAFRGRRRRRVYTPISARFWLDVATPSAAGRASPASRSTSRWAAF